MELENIKDKLNKIQYNYFLGLKDLIDLPIYFIGSIARSDYIPDKSDLDIEIFSNNILSTKLKIEYLFNYQYKKLKFIIFYINDKPFSGYKYYFDDKIRDIKFDFTVYNIECKDILLQHRKKEINLPFTYSLLFYILKNLYYNLYIINKKIYTKLKQQFWQFYNPEKSISFYLNNAEYSEFYNNALPNITYLINL